MRCRPSSRVSACVMTAWAASAYVDWVRRCARYAGVDPSAVQERHLGPFPGHLATERRVAPSTQKQALSALVLFLKEVLGQHHGSVGHCRVADRPRQLPPSKHAGPTGLCGWHQLAWCHDGGCAASVSTGLRSPGSPSRWCGIRRGIRRRSGLSSGPRC
ncbi:MAG: phage integrase N-terminal SAM-like domain-containing protein [Planctomycetota bacterium]